MTMSNHCVLLGAHDNGDKSSMIVFVDDDSFVHPNCPVSTPVKEDKVL